LPFSIPYSTIHRGAAENGGGLARPSGREEVNHVQGDREKGDGGQEADLGKAAPGQYQELALLNWPSIRPWTHESIYEQL